jgi:hypothetical protein
MEVANWGVGPLCHLYTFYDTECRFDRVKRRVKSAICAGNAVKGFEFTRVTSVPVTYDRAVKSIETSTRGKYPNAAIVRYDGELVHMVLADGSVAIYPETLG